MHDSPFYAPDSTLALFLYSGIQYLIVTILLTFNRPFIHETQRRSLHLRNRYRGFFGGLEKAADETAPKRSTDIYLHILGWTMDALGEDATLEKFSESRHRHSHGDPARLRHPHNTGITFKHRQRLRC